MVSGLKLVLCHLVLRKVARGNSLLVSPGSPATSAGFHKTRTLDLTKHNMSEDDSTAQKHSVISINQSNELSTSSGQQDACNSFMI
jgi:hypothetical protein